MHMAAGDALERMDSTVDLRRRTSRELAEVICRRAAWCTPSDRVLVSAIYEDGMTASQIAIMSCRSPRAVRRKIRQLVARILSDRFTYVLQNRDAWPPTRRRVATACVLHGRSMRNAAKHLNVTMHTIRKEMGIIEALCASPAPTPAAAAQPAHRPGSPTDRRPGHPTETGKFARAEPRARATGVRPPLRLVHSDSVQAARGGGS